MTTMITRNPQNDVRRNAVRRVAVRYTSNNASRIDARLVV